MLIPPAALLLLVLPFIPFRHIGSSFREVNDRNLSSGDIIHSSQKKGINPDADYVIHDGRLFLKYQETRSAVLLVTGGRFIQWTPEKLQELRAGHPEVEHYLPDPSKADGGIPWFEKWVP
jgi:hypothetical protein